MKIVYLGNHAISYSTETHFKKTLESMGHFVLPLQESKTEVRDILNESLKADLFIWSKTHTWETPGMGDVLSKLRKADIPSVAYHLDAFMFIPDRWRYYQNHDYFKVQYFFTPDKNLANWITANRNRGYYLPAGVLEQECVEVEPAREVQPIVFVGSRKYHAQWSYRPTLINWLQKNYGDDFGHYGNDGIRVIRGLELNSVLQGTKIVIGDSYSPNYNYPNFWSDRVYETTGRGGFIIHPYIKGIETQFEIGKEIEVYKFQDAKGLKEKIDFYLNFDDKREQIRHAGQARTLKDHTYAKRWEHILQVIK